MSMDHRNVHVMVAVPAGQAACVHMIVMGVAMHVLMIVRRCRMAVHMVMVAPHDERLPGRADQEGHQLVPGHRVPEHRPRHPHPEERCSGEHQLSACRAEFAGPRHPQRDRQPITDCTDGE